MSNLLPTWRQRIGALVLAMALMFVGAWLRGFVNEDIIPMDDREMRVVMLGNHSLTLGSFQGGTVEEADGRRGLNLEFVQDLEVPYWSILLPLCLLAAYLLLVKPRTAKPSKETEVASNSRVVGVAVS